MEENLDVIRKVVREILAVQSDLSKSEVKAEKKPRKPYTRRDLEAYERAKETNLMSRKLTNAIQHAEKLQRFREEDWVKLQQSSLLTHPKLAPKKQRLEHLFQPIMEVDEPEEQPSIRTRPEKRKAEALTSSINQLTPQTIDTPASTAIQLPPNIFASLAKTSVPLKATESPPEVLFKPKTSKVVTIQPEAIEPLTEEISVVLPPIVKKQQETLQMSEPEKEDDVVKMYLQMLA